MRVHITLRRGMVYLLPLAVLGVAVGVRIASPDLLDRLSLICFDLYQRAAPREEDLAASEMIVCLLRI